MQNFTHNPPFYSRSEARQEPLAPEEMRLFNLLRWIQAICWLVTIVSPLALGAYIHHAVSQPCWKATITEMRMLEKQIIAHNNKRVIYSHATERINHRIRFDLLTVPILSPAPKKIFLDEVDYKSSTDMLSGEVTIHGHSTKPELDPIKEYIDDLEKAIQSFLPDFKVNLKLANDSSDPKTGNLKFIISGKIQ